ncbi:hypothetical protein CDL12_17477 [Handroanthus impetiginosus]|uniref:Uncharacterized protein n=1 Tax=Handroanthus impetiginosus TaxID=429701 RepID=A0A2G9GY55_9LAMI|nr:hypothetical protein CDL12_17477 [Handroanthus impetiginosus]
MDQNEDKRRRKNERDRLAYKRVSANKKAELLQRRRQQYRQRVERRRNEMPTSQSSNILESQAINIVVNSCAADIDLSNATTAVAISNSLNSLDGPSSSHFDDTMNENVAGDFGSAQVRQSSRNTCADRFVCVSNVPTAS